MHVHLTATLAGGGDIIVLDWTFLFEVLLFLLLLVVLNALVFKPVMRVLDAREAATDGAKEEAAAVRRQAASLSDGFDAQLREVRAAAAEQREQLRQEGAKLEAELIEEARADVAKTMAEADERIAEETAAARATLHAAVPGLAAAMASKVLGREVTGREVTGREVVSR